MGFRQLKVLVVDDNEEDCHLTKRYLLEDEKGRYFVETLDSIRALRELAKSDSFDIVLLDLNLLDVSGLDTLLQCRQVVGGLPIIVITGINDEALGEKAVQLGAQDYIPKDELNAPLLKRTIRLALERHLLMEALTEKAFKDELTLLPNRRAFKERLANTLVTAQKNDESFAVVLFDLNGFKPINDEYGHDAGDQVLSQLGAKLRMNTRRRDFFARIGGDEFSAIITSLYSIDQLQRVIRNNILIFESEFYIIIDDQIITKTLTVSIGAAMYPLDGQEGKELLKLADQNMYDVKRKNSSESDFKIGK
ncbi:GGDEF domain-containing protein [Pleionea litopenaei]|uniref:diguanylate cyclase n=1 Tax=Pleionea litopenaei TaxID=3070815 RepID=A0AA51RTK3_9GAMM|nr:diguanylate cyclase response regulator [Pleionea sp. HL-JVS1]WMS87408.1 diguanylate cyclase response regulator [Pleionea sp. HL-JVS1]